MKTAIQQLIEFINKMQNDGSGGLRVQAILDYAESLEQSHTSPMSAEQVELLESSKIALHTLDCIEFTREQGTASKRLETAISKLATTPSVKADGWVSVDKEKEFHKVLKCLKNNKVMVGTREDGIYIRLAGRESEGEAFTLHFALAYPFPKLPPHQNKNK